MADGTPSAPSVPAGPPDAGAPTAPAKPSAAASPEKPDAGAATGTKELDWAAGNDCGKVDSELKRRMGIFNAKLTKEKFSIVVTRCHRDALLQKRWHYARFVSWSEASVKRALKNNKSTEDVQKIKANALRLFKDLEGLKTDEEAKAKAAEIRDANFASNPVLPAENNCPCGCGWLHSKHVDDPTRAVDIKIQTPEGRILVNSNTTKDDPNYELINKLTSESNLFWGINFTQIPQDPIHWELPD
jgi:hypothetical protein